MMFQFATPLMLLAMPLPLLMRLLPPRHVAGQAMRLPSAVALAARPVGARMHWRGLLPMALAWVLLCLALAGPQRILMQPDRSASGRDIIIALDMSGSMETPDFTLDGQTVTRLAAVKSVASSFIRARHGDRIGLVIFADRAYVAAPPTHDLTTVIRALDEAEIGLTGRSTSISDGLGLALKRVLAEPVDSRVILLLSDGRDTSARLDANLVAALAAENGVRIHSIALGPEDLETNPSARDAVDITALRAIASASGGQTFRVHGTGDLEPLAETLDQLEPNPADRPPVAVPQPLWHWLAALALALILTATLVRPE